MGLLYCIKGRGDKAKQLFIKGVDEEKGEVEAKGKDDATNEDAKGDDATSALTIQSSRLAR